MMGHEPVTLARRLGTASVILLPGLLLSACAKDQSTSSSDVTISAGSGVFSPEEQEVVDAVDDYYTALFGRGDQDIETTMDGRLTDELAGRLIPDEKAFTEDKGLQYIGEHELDPRRVSIEGETARFTGCVNTSQLFLVEAGTTQTGPGSIAVGSSDLDFELLREDGRWLISQPTGEEASC